MNLILRRYRFNYHVTKQYSADPIPLFMATLYVVNLLHIMLLNKEIHRPSLAAEWGK